MRGVAIRMKPVRVLLAKALGRHNGPVTLGPFSPTRLMNLPEPKLPADDWVRLSVIQCGVCSSDVDGVLFHHRMDSVLGAFVSFPVGMGHEIVARVVETGRAVSSLKPGDRVVVEPYLACASRGIDPLCRSCAADEITSCENFDKGRLPRTIAIGANNFTGGGWGERLVAPAANCFVVPDGLSDDAATVIEPFGCALHAVGKRLPADGETALVMGAGTIGLSAVMSIRARGSRARVLCVARHPYQADFARRLGADVVLLERGRALYERMSELTGASLVKSILGANLILMGGVDVVFDTVGSSASITDSLRFTRAGGTAMLLGTQGARGFDATPAWFKQIRVTGSLGHGVETVGAERIKTFDLALRLAVERQLPLADFVTHRFAIADWRGALRAFRDKGRSRAVKIVLKP